MGVSLTIAPDFKALCQPLSEEELRLLEESLLEEGCREPIVVWKCGKQTLIVDGHNRYAICIKHQLAYKVRYLEYESRQGAMGWAARNQLGRRNATEEHKSYLRGKLYRETKLPPGRPPASEVSAQSAHFSESQKTAENIAEETGVDAATVRRDEKFSTAVDALAEKSEPLKDAALRGDIPKSSVEALATAPKRILSKLEKLEGKELRKAIKEALEAMKPKEDYGKCPNCAGTKWTEDDDGVTCSKCSHPHGEPAGDVDENRIKIQRSKTVKTAEALMRAFDDLHTMLAKPEHDEAIETCKWLMKVARNWK